MTLRLFPTFESSAAMQTRRGVATLNTPAATTASLANEGRFQVGDAVKRILLSGRLGTVVRVGQKSTHYPRVVTYVDDLGKDCFAFEDSLELYCDPADARCKATLSQTEADRITRAIARPS